MRSFNTYATDGKCHNADDGVTECGQPATWTGTKPSGWTSGFCDQCKSHGQEARRMTTWTRLPGAAFTQTTEAQHQTTDRATVIDPGQPALF